ncbi:MAG TPA: hypothetical protein DCX07_07190 [Phycisphaerales bacterium]|nr:hypothetical protein [Phycisphaerales bacterium]
MCLLLPTFVRLVFLAAVLAAFIGLASPSLLMAEMPDPPGAELVAWTEFDRQRNMGAITKYWTLHPESGGTMELVVPPGNDIHAKSSLVIRSTEPRLVFYQKASRTELRGGGHYRLLVRLRGKGQVRVGCGVGVPNSTDPPGLVASTTAVAQPVRLKEEEQLVELKFTAAPREGPAIAQVWLEIAEGGAEVIVSGFRLYRQWDPRLRIKVSPEHLMAPMVGKAAVTVQLLQDGKPAPARRLVLSPVSDNPKTAPAAICEMALDTSATGVFHIPASVDQRVGWTVADPESGSLRNFYADVLPRDLWERYEQVAAKIELDKPLHILVLGDSLTDMQRGGNWVDKLSFWLSLRSKASVTVTNAAIGGDTISRVWNRLNGRISAYESDRYPEWKDLRYGKFTPKPDWVFVFVGHNDSKLTAASGYTQSFVPIEQFEKDYAALLNIVKERTHARIFVLSCAATQHQITKARVTQNKNYFGEPKTMARYNETIAHLAKQSGAEYVDIFTPMTAAPNPRDLFGYDGIHLNNAGNRFVALELLRFLSSTGRQP